MKKLGKEQIKTLMELKLGFENHLEEIKEMKIETKNKKFDKQISKLRDRMISNANNYNGLLDKLANEEFDVPGYLYIDMGDKVVEIIDIKPKEKEIEVVKNSNNVRIIS